MTVTMEQQLLQANQEIFSCRKLVRVLTKELCVAEEEERRRIATDLHDRVVQTLTLIKMVINQPAKSRGEFARVIERVKTLVNKAIEETRSVVYETTPPALYEHGFGPAVAWLAQHVSTQFDIPVTVHDQGGYENIDDKTGQFFYRATRELLMNAVKHSCASKISIAMMNADGRLRLCIEDNGQGFDPLDCHPDIHKGFGLSNIQTRIGNCGGSVEITSEIGSGTRITLTAPINNTTATPPDN